MGNKEIQESPVLTHEDFKSDQMVKWCPGCGNHAILNAVTKVFPLVGHKKENYVVVSGIGCSSRFPYYVSLQIPLLCKHLRISQYPWSGQCHCNRCAFS